MHAIFIDSKYLFSSYAIIMWFFICFRLICLVSWQTSDWNKKYILLKYITNQLRCSALFFKHIISTTERRWALSPIFSGGKRKYISKHMFSTTETVWRFFQVIFIVVPYISTRVHFSTSEFDVAVFFSSYWSV